MWCWMMWFRDCSHSAGRMVGLDDLPGLLMILWLGPGLGTTAPLELW